MGKKAIVRRRAWLRGAGKAMSFAPREPLVVAETSAARQFSFANRVLSQASRRVERTMYDRHGLVIVE